jgi:hypothetical protein
MIQSGRISESQLAPVTRPAQTHNLAYVTSLSARQLRAALTRFESLLEARAKERDFQRLFADCPYILSSTLPLRLEPSEIRPLGRPGKSEPDFIVFPQSGGLRSGYSVIELKRPHLAYSVNRARAFSF